MSKIKKKYLDFEIYEQSEVDTISGSIVAQIPQYDYAESEGESSTSLGSYQLKLRLTTGTVISGTYRIGWSYEFSGSTNKDECGFNVDVDSGTIIHESLDISPVKYSDGGYKTNSGFKYVVLSNATHTIDINYLAAATTYIRRARLEVTSNV